MSVLRGLLWIGRTASEEEVEDILGRHAECREHVCRWPFGFDADVILWTMTVDGEDVDVDDVWFDTVDLVGLVGDVSLTAGVKEYRLLECRGALVQGEGHVSALRVERSIGMGFCRM